MIPLITQAIVMNLAFTSPHVLFSAVVFKLSVCGRHKQITDNTIGKTGMLLPSQKHNPRDHKPSLQAFLLFSSEEDSHVGTDNFFWEFPAEKKEANEGHNGI